MTGLRRDYVEVDGRLVHLRRAGAGPPLLLLHQSPRSSAELEPLIAALADRWSVIAPDTPGNGLSDPLHMRDPEIEPFADALARLLDVLGIARCGVYGYHTGAAMAAGLALRHHERIAFAVLNGLPGFDRAERLELIARYLPRFEPRWDGSHLTWAWARLREQTIFFPWYDTRAAARMDYDVPPPEALHEACLDLLRAGDHYRDAYGAAFRLEGPRIAAHLQVPTAIVATARDPLRPHLDRLAGLPPHVAAQQIVPGIDAVRDLIDGFAHLADGAHGASGALPGATRRAYAGAAGSQLHVRRFDRGSGPLLLMIDGRYGGGAVVARLADAAATWRPVVAVCLPGCGESDDSAATFADVAALLDLADAETLVVGTGSDAASVQPDPTGAYLQSAWQQVRDTHLFAGGAPVRAAIRADAPAELAQLQIELVARLQQRRAVAVNGLSFPDTNDLRRPPCSR